MRISPFLLGAAAIASSVSVVRTAHAQAVPSVTGILGAVERCEPSLPCTNADAPGETPHPSGMLDNEIDVTDCDADLFYQFELALANPSSSYLLEIWAGSQDCSQLVNRQTSATSVCWPVAAPVQVDANTYSYDIRVQDIVSGVFATTHPVVYAPMTDPAVCQFPPQPDTTNVTLYAFFVDGASNSVGTVQQYPMVIVAGDAGAGEGAGAGEEDGGRDSGVAVGELAPGGAGCTMSGRGPADRGGLVGLGVAAIGVSVIRKRRRRRGAP